MARFTKTVPFTWVNRPRGASRSRLRTQFVDMPVKNTGGDPAAGCCTGIERRVILLADGPPPNDANGRESPSDARYWIEAIHHSWVFSEGPGELLNAF